MENPRRYALVGGGVMAEAILRALLASGVATPDRVLASDPVPARRAALGQLGIRAVETNPEATAGADVVILAVKPGVVAEALGSASGLHPGQLLISIAAGVPLATVEGLVPPGMPVVRAMPNILLTVRQAATAICAGRHATADHLSMARQVFEAGGRVVEVPEAQMDAVTGLSGSGPGYVMVLIEALADGGVQAGLPRPVALTLAAQTVLGSAQLALESEEHPALWKDRVATPAGTTIAGLAALEAAGVRGALMRAVVAATERAREISEQS